VRVRIKSKKLKVALEDDLERKKTFGEPMAKKIKLRLDALAAAESLADFWPPHSGPERCHELKGNLKGTFSVDVKQPYRLLFTQVEVERDAVSENEGKKESEDSENNEIQRWRSINSIEILGVEDTHD
jgi:plasmid maintenance system killer protein